MDRNSCSRFLPDRLLRRAKLGQNSVRGSREPAAGLLRAPHGRIGAVENAPGLIAQVHELLDVAALLGCEIAEGAPPFISAQPRVVGK